MKKIQDFYKNEFSNISLDSDNSKKIYESIINNKKNNNYLKVSFAIITVIAIGFFGVINAETIKEQVKQIWYHHVVDVDNNEYINPDYENIIKDINQIDYEEINQEIALNKCKSDLYDKYVDEFSGLDLTTNPCYKEYTYDAYEDDLKVKLVRSTISDKSRLVLKIVEKEDNKISYIQLYSPNITNVLLDKQDKYEPYETNDDNTKFDLSIIIKTPYYKEKTENEEEKDYYSQAKKMHWDMKEYNIDKLNTKALVYETTPEGWRTPNYVIDFVYDNILYEINMKINNIEKYPFDKEIDRILNSFYVKED